MSRILLNVKRKEQFIFISIKRKFTFILWYISTFWYKIKIQVYLFQFETSKYQQLIQNCYFYVKKVSLNIFPNTQHLLSYISNLI